MKTTTKFFLVILLFCSFINAEQARNEFSIYVGGGFSSLMYDVLDEQGRQKNGFGGHAGLGYTLFFSNYFGIGTGVEIAQYRAKYKIDELSLSVAAYDAFNGENFILNSSISEYVEKQLMTSLQVPLMFQFQIGKPDKHNFYFALGGKGGVSLAAKAEGNNPKIITSGYYPYVDYTYTNVPQAGFGSYEAKGQKTELDFKTSILASAEAGIKWKLKNNNAFYTGLFLDHGILKSITKRPAENFVEYDPNNPQEYTLNSALNSGFVDKIIPVSGGLKVKLAFGWGKISDKDDAIEAEEPEEEIVEEEVIEEEPEPEPAVEEEVVEEEPEEVEEAIVVVEIKEEATVQEGIGFEHNSAKLTENSYATLNGIVKTMEENPEMNVEVAGHTSIEGGYDYNMELSKARANAVVDYLVSNGIAKERLKAVGFGPDKPIADNETEEGRVKNRRVELKKID